MERPIRRPAASRDPREDQAVSTALAVALAIGAAGFGFGAYFYAVPFKRKAAQLEHAQKELRARAEPPRPRMDVQGEDAATRLQSMMKSLQTEIEGKLGSVSPAITLGPIRMLVRFPEEKLFDSRGPWFSKAGQDAIQALGQILGTRCHRVVIAAPMGAGTVPRWVRPQLPTPADLSAARAGSALKALVKGGVRAETVLAVIGTVTADDAAGTPTLDFEVEP
jgi:hypothetical protein